MKDGLFYETVYFSHKLTIQEIKRILVFKDEFPPDIVIERA